MGTRSRTGLLQGRRSVVVLAIVAVVSLAAGVLLSRLIVSPAQAAARRAAPTAGPITVPIEQRAIASTVTVRADVAYSDPMELTIENGGRETPAVVTGQVPENGSQVEPGSVVLEITGRPVIVLPGDLPVYRTLGAGMAGPDVLQLRAALQAVGINGGDPANPTYDAALARAVETLFRKVGYQPPAIAADQKGALDSAQAGVTSAQSELTNSQSALNKAKNGATAAEKAKLDSAVTIARQALADANSQCALPSDERADWWAGDCSATGLARLQADLDSAIADRAAADAAPDTSGEQAQVTAAQTALSDAQKALSEAQTDALTPLPASEVIYVPSLPRRIDSVTTGRGQTVSGTFATVSGAVLQAVGTVSIEDATIMPPGTKAVITLDDVDIPVTVTAVNDATKETNQGEEAGGSTSKEPDPTHKSVVFAFDNLTPDQSTTLQGRNVRIKVPVTATDGDVLAVPLAALSAGPGGESRVEIYKDGETHLVEVKTGLSAGGYVEISDSEEPLTKGQLVVVGVAPASEEEEDEG